MDTELQAFRTQLRAAGQPYSLWGGRIFGVGLVILVAGQVMSAYALALVGLSVLVMGVGWVMLVIAFVRRRRWAKAQAQILPPLS